MLSTLLVPLDGSPLAESALPYAEALATRTGARLAIMRAAMAHALPGRVGQAQLRAIREAEAYLTPLAARLETRGLNVEMAIPYGPPRSWIAEEVEIRHADLVVMATHDRTGASRWLRGSIAEAVVARSTVPVLLVRAADGLRPAQRFSQSRPRLIVPLDGSPLAEAALPPAQQLAQALNARLILVVVVPSPEQLVYGESGVIVSYAGEMFEEGKAEAEYYLERLVGQLWSDTRLAVQSEVRFGHAADQIGAAAAEHGAAAVVMATHGRTGLVRTLLGSVAGAVVHQGLTPVMLVRPRVEAAAATQPSTGRALVRS